MPWHANLHWGGLGVCSDSLIGWDFVLLIRWLIDIVCFVILIGWNEIFGKCSGLFFVLIKRELQCYIFFVSACPLQYSCCVCVCVCGNLVLWKFTSVLSPAITYNIGTGYSTTPFSPKFVYSIFDRTFLKALPDFLLRTLFMKCRFVTSWGGIGYLHIC